MEVLVLGDRTEERPIVGPFKTVCGAFQAFESKDVLLLLNIPNAHGPVET